MIVGVDARHLAGGRGVAHYTAELLAALAAAHPQDSWRAFVPGRHDVRSPPGVDLVRHRLPSRPIFGAAALTGRPRLDRLVGGADVGWIPAPAPVAVSPGVPYVLTVHDLSWVERPSDFTRYERLWHRLARVERLARRAAAVVTDTEAVRLEVLARWDLDPGRVHVVRPGVTAPSGATALPPGVGEPFFLVLGALEPRKAPDVVLLAYERARAEGLQASLVFAGDGRLADGLGGPGVQVLGRVGDPAPLLRAATALVMPSRLEGFGFTPLEAALAGTPSIVSDLPVFEETLGPWASRVPVDDADALARAMLRMEAEEELRTRTALEAARQARGFTWVRAAGELHAILAAAA